MEPEGSLLSSQDPATDPYPEPDASSPHFPTLISPRFVLMLSPHLHLGLFPLGFATKILYAALISPTHATCPSDAK